MDDKVKEFRKAIEDAQPAKFPDFTKIRNNLKSEARNNVFHSPIQQGPILICRSCTTQHTIAYVGMDKILVGVKENGEPILEPRKM